MAKNLARSPLAPKHDVVLRPVSGVRLATANSGLKYKGRPDLLLAVLDPGSTIAGVLTTSKTRSAPVDLCRENLKAGSVRGIVVNAGNAPSNATPWTMKFYEAYTKRWGIEPEGLGTSSSYMAVHVLKDAIERAGSLDPDEVVAALEKTDMMGVYGRLRFDPKSHQVIPSTDPKEGAVGSILQWQNGQRVVVYPKSIAMGEIQLPPWMGR
jgi:hypothetical protein